MISLALFIVSVIVSMISILLLLKFILWLYPHYTNFYSNNFYNSIYYLFAFVGISWLVHYFFMVKLLKNVEGQSILASVIFFSLLLMILAHFYVTTATFIFYYPILVLLTFLILGQKFKRFSGNWFYVGLFPTIALWVPLVYVIIYCFFIELALCCSLLFIITIFGFITSLLREWQELKRRQVA